MKSIVLMTVCVYAIVLAYTDIDDTFDIDSLVKNTTVLKKYLDCFIDIEPCTKYMQTAKGHLLQAVGDACAECDITQRHMLHVFLLAVKEKIPQELKDFQAKYDPNGGHLVTAEKALSNA